MATVLLFFVVLFVLVVVHEWGHYFAAKRTGMRVDEFGVGFPPKLVGVKRGETEYTLNTLPLGGFVRIYGEAIVHDPGEEQDPDHNRAMWARPRWAQALVLIAGVAMNVVLAWVLYVAVFMMGVPTAVDEATASPNAILYVASVLDTSPLRDQVIPGSQIVGVRSGEAELTRLTPTGFTDFVAASGQAPLELRLRSGETETVVTVTPQPGVLPDDPTRPAVGVSLALVEITSHGLWSALVRATGATWQGLTAITAGIATLLGGVATGTADFSQVAGPVGIAGMVGDAATLGITTLLSFVAIISLNLAVVNLLPFPALDGGRLLLLGGEVLFRRPANHVWVHRLNAFGFILLLVFMIIVTYHDIVRLFTN
jgi:regulator of sigma E protease